MRGAISLNVYVQVLSTGGAPIGEYYVAQAVLSGTGFNGTQDIGISGLMEWFPHRHAEAVWRRWAISPPTRNGEWAKLSLERRQAWLEVVGLHRKFRMQSNVRIEPEGEFFMKGAGILDVVSFFCAIGEAVNGPGGYYGWNFTALADCLTGGFGPAAPFVLHWDEFETARKYLLGKVESRGGLNQIGLLMEILKRAGVDVVTS